MTFSHKKPLKLMPTGFSDTISIIVLLLYRCILYHFIHYQNTFISMVIGVYFQQIYSYTCP
nr:MAG TPA: hypothetical protein [Bacteriophage sp.]